MVQALAEINDYFQNQLFPVVCIISVIKSPGSSQTKVFLKLRNAVMFQVLEELNVSLPMRMAWIRAHLRLDINQSRKYFSYIFAHKINAYLTSKHTCKRKIRTELVKHFLEIYVHFLIICLKKTYYLMITNNLRLNNICSWQVALVNKVPNLNWMMY